MRRKLLATTVAAAAISLVLAGCGTGPAPEKKAGAAGKNAIKACMVSDEGGFDDKSFNQSGYEGLMKAKDELGVKVAKAESNSDGDFDRNLDSMVKEKCDLIIGVGFKMAKQIDAKAKANPNIKFALVDSDFESHPSNARALLFNTAEASYLAGYVAAGMSKTGKVGTFLGMKIPTTAIFADGFADGVKKYNEDNGKNVELLGWNKEKQDGIYTGDFSDTAKGKNNTKQLMDQGADIIMQVAGPVGAGTVSAVTEAKNGTSIVWVDADGFNTEPAGKDFFLTSVVKEIGASVFDTVKSVQDGKFDSTPYVGDLKNGGVGIAPYHNFDSKVPADLKKKVEELKKKIISGEIKVESKNQPGAQK
ncbi:MAG: BMP family ABC transporter substrate-binding protein [Actinomycetaceae bacterium]|nr:BMP family ABC transporter substrate-binding protein [Actinomycetaceae bacterium]